MALVKLLRLQQIVSGFVKLEDIGEKTHLFEDAPRSKVLKELLEEITPDNKVIVWAKFKQNYEQIRVVCRQLGIKWVEIHGGISAKEKEQSILDFRNDSDVRVCIANQASAGTGVNLVEASYMIYFTRSFSLDDDLQSESRNYRGGSNIHEKITRIDLVSKDTVDEVILGALRNKKKIADIILDKKEMGL